MLLKKLIYSIIFYLIAFEAVYARSYRRPTDSHKITPRGRIIHGNITNIENARYHADLIRKIDGEIAAMCGGSLIAWNVVVTAAHCVQDKETKKYFATNTLLVSMGNVRRFNFDSNTVLAAVSKLIHADYGNENPVMIADIALLILENPVPSYHPVVKPIAVNRRQLPADTVCQATGFGETEDGVPSPVLKIVNVKLIDRDFCIQKSWYPKGIIKSDILCAGDFDAGRYDTCSGDSGGPLVCMHALTAIVHGGTQKCGTPFLPGLYTDISYWASWIDTKLQEQGIYLPGGLKKREDIASSDSDDTDTAKLFDWFYEAFPEQKKFE